jgi:UDP-N-acetylglucosamine/UDP-N-acetylgalactosamine diphosphorylase
MLIKAPDGNGGMYEALLRSGALETMQARGVRAVHVFGVDNILVRVADPAFLGFAIHERLLAGNKVVMKENPHEKVGVMAIRNGLPGVMESILFP